MPTLQQEDETAVYWLTALQMWYELEKDLGFFERTSDMVFCLQRKVINGKVKQCPVIRFKEH